MGHGASAKALFVRRTPAWVGTEAPVRANKAPGKRRNRGRPWIVGPRPRWSSPPRAEAIVLNRLALCRLIKHRRRPTAFMVICLYWRMKQLHPAPLRKDRSLQPPWSGCEPDCRQAPGKHRHGARNDRQRRKQRERECETQKQTMERRLDEPDYGQRTANSNCRGPGPVLISNRGWYRCGRSEQRTASGSTISTVISRPQH